jgi:hypothetical protein
MSFSEIASQIVKKSIRSAICIDDEFAEPYERKSKKIKSLIPKQLYVSFRKNWECSLDFYRYRNAKDWSLMKDNVLSNKDLVILDWELESISPKYLNTLKIFDDIVQHKTNQFVIIYTHSPDLDDIVTNIYAFFSKANISYKDFKIIEFEKLYEEITDEDSKDFKTELKRLISKDSIFNHKYKLDEILLGIGIEKRKIGLLMKSFKESFKFTDCNEILQVLLLKLYYLDGHTNIKSREVNKLKTDQITLNVDNTFVVITNKVSKENPDGIIPENLFSYFSKAITTSPNNSISLMACELKDLFRSNVAIIGHNIPKIDEKAFFNHWNNLRNEEDMSKEEADSQFKYFLIENWLNELSQFTINTSSSNLFFNAIEAYAEENNMFNLKDEDIVHIELLRLGALYSTLNIEKEQRTNKKIQFGDIFEIETNEGLNNSGEVLLSITPHCDAIRPNKKLKNQLHFIKGSIIKDKAGIHSALMDSEKDNYSFIEIHEKPLCIKWSIKPFTIHIVEGINDINNTIDVIIQGTQFKLKHSTILKENYTQRIANHSFSDAMRVGITLPSLKN